MLYNKTNKYIVTIELIWFVVFALISQQFMTEYEKDDLVKITGHVEDISGYTSSAITICLEGNKKKFHIPGRIKPLVNARRMKDLVTGDEIILFYVARMSCIDRINSLSDNYKLMGVYDSDKNVILSHEEVIANQSDNQLLYFTVYLLSLTITVIAPLLGYFALLLTRMNYEKYQHLEDHPLVAYKLKSGTDPQD